MRENELATIVVDLCFKIHKQYGPGLFESVYEEIFCHEWDKNGITYQRQYSFPLVHESIRMGLGFRADIVIENKIIVELKSVEDLAPIHQRQVATYLKLMDLRLGILVNFNVPLIKDGIRRVANKI